MSDQWWMPQNYYLGGGAAETSLSQVGAAILILAIVLLLCLPRRLIVVPVLLTLFLVPEANVVVIGGLHLMPVRILSGCAWVRLALLKATSGKSLFGDRLNSVDSAFVTSVLCHAIAFVLLWRTSAAIVNQAGCLWSSLGMYFLLRYLIQDEQDTRTVIKTFAIIVVCQAVAMVYEQVRVQNLFALLIGGGSAVPEVRDGQIRSQGIFGHAILAGTAGATLFPLFLILWKSRAKILAVVGLISSVVMVSTAASSTPYSAMGAMIVALCFWPLRRRMRQIRWAILLGLVLTQLAMKAPVWFLIAHVNLTGSSSGYHRALLVDQFIRNFFNWWLLGTRDNGSWGLAMFDESNMYVSQGESGGILALIFFIAMISRSFARLGRMRKVMEGKRNQEYLLWFLGVALFAHLTAFFGISYWDQSESSWFALLAMISACTTPIGENGAGSHRPVENMWSEASCSDTRLPTPTRAVLRDRVLATC